MPIHSTNYSSTFILVSADCPARTGMVPVTRGDPPTIARMQYELIANFPYQHTSDDVLFYCFARKHRLEKSQLSAAREEFFSRAQACLRSSPLVKRYGWGIHSNAEGKVAIYEVGSKEYEAYSKNTGLRIIKGMRSAR